MKDVASRHAVDSVSHVHARSETRDTEHTSASVRSMKRFGILCSLVALSCGGSDAFPIEGVYSISSGACSVFSEANPGGHRMSLAGVSVDIGPPSSPTRRPEGCETVIWMHTDSSAAVEVQFCVGVEDPPGWWSLTTPSTSPEHPAIQMDDEVVRFRSADVSMSRLSDAPELAIEAQGMDIENEVPARLSCVLSLTEL